MHSSPHGQFITPHALTSVRNVAGWAKVVPPWIVLVGVPTVLIINRADGLWGAQHTVLGKITYLLESY